jgi:hypothetical protein
MFVSLFIAWPQITVQDRLDFCSLSEMKERNLKSLRNVNFMNFIDRLNWKKDKERVICYLLFAGQPRLARTALVRLFKNQRMNETAGVASNGMRLFISFFSPSEGTRCHVRPSEIANNARRLDKSWASLLTDTMCTLRPFKMQEFHRNHKTVHFRTVQLVLWELLNLFWVHTWCSEYLLCLVFISAKIFFYCWYMIPYSRQFFMAGEVFHGRRTTSRRQWVFSAGE